MRPKKLAQNYTQENVTQAVHLVQQKVMSLREAAQHYNVPRSTIYDKVKGSAPIQRRSRTILTAEQEEKLVKWLTETARRGCGRTKEQLLCAVQQILKASEEPNPFKHDKPGGKWYYNFLARHPQISMRKTHGVGLQRAIISEQRARAWFTEAEQCFAEGGINIRKVPPESIFNCDEIGFPFNISTGHVLTSKEDKQVYSITSDTEQQITVLGCGSASGQLLKPLLIYPGQKFAFNPQHQFPELEFACSINGWIDSEIFKLWLEKTFIPAISHLHKPVFLFMDGHTTHISIDIHNMCKAHHIVYYTLPTHASHIVQPLDLFLHKSLKTEWSSAEAAYREMHSENVKTDNFATVLRQAWNKAYAPSKLISAFEAAGISPWNMDRVNYTKCAANQAFNPTASSTSAPAAATAHATVSAFTTLQAETSASSAGVAQNETPASAFPTTPETTSAFTTPQARTSASSAGLAQNKTPASALTTLQAGTFASSTGVAQNETPPTTASADSSFSNPVELSESFLPQEDTSFYLDKMVEFVASKGWSVSKAYEMRKRLQNHEQPAEMGDEEYRTYTFLYSKIVPKPSFDNQPLVSSWIQNKSKAPRVQPPNFVSGDKFK